MSGNKGPSNQFQVFFHGKGALDPFPDVAEQQGLFVPKFVHKRLGRSQSVEKLVGLLSQTGIKIVGGIGNIGRIRPWFVARAGGCNLFFHQLLVIRDGCCSCAATLERCHPCLYRMFQSCG